MQKNQQSLPLAPSKDHLKSDMESGGVFTLPRKIRTKKSSKFPVCLLAGIVIILAVLLFFSMIVLRLRKPGFKIAAVTVKKLVYGPASSPSFNITVGTEIAVENPNFGKFEFEKTTVSFYYGSEAVGILKVPAGVAGIKGTVKKAGTVDLNYGGGAGVKNLSSDINLGVLELNGHGQISGRVRLFKILERRKTAEMNCLLTFDLNRRAVTKLGCD